MPISSAATPTEQSVLKPGPYGPGVPLHTHAPGEYDRGMPADWNRVIKEHFLFASVATTVVYFVVGLCIGYLSLL